MSTSQVRYEGFAIDTHELKIPSQLHISFHINITVNTLYVQ